MMHIKTGLKDFTLEAAMGNIPGVSTLNKFGRAPSGLQTTATDIWDRADATPTQSVWTAPTQARVHAIVSTSDTDSDTGGDNPQAAGLRTLRVYGLTDWDTAEVSEDIIMDGTTAKNTANSYVIIHRMHALTKGATAGANVGTITATAATDGTVTAAILPGKGQTLMAIYGVPSTHTAYVGRIYANILGTPGANSAATASLLVNPEPDTELTGFLTKHTFSIIRDGVSAFTIPYYVPKVFAGPTIIKLSGISTVNDLDVSGGFDAFIIKN